MLASLQRARSRSTSPEIDKIASPTRCGIRASAWRYDPATVEYWKQRAIEAFEHVRRESVTASNILEFKVELLCILGNECEDGKMGGRITTIWK